MNGTQQFRVNTLMLIDDNKIDQMLYRRIVERSGKVRTLRSFLMASDALDDLANPETAMPDLILLDINMPRMNGFEFLEAAEQMFGTAFAPVIVMLTTSLDPKDRVRATQISAIREFLNKPLTPQTFEQILDLV